MDKWASIMALMLSLTLPFFAIAEDGRAAHGVSPYPPLGMVRHGQIFNLEHEWWVKVTVPTAERGIFNFGKLVIKWYGDYDEMMADYNRQWGAQLGNWKRGWFALSISSDPMEYWVWVRALPDGRVLFPIHSFHEMLHFFKIMDGRLADVHDIRDLGAWIGVDPPLFGLKKSPP